MKKVEEVPMEKVEEVPMDMPAVNNNTDLNGL